RHGTPVLAQPDTLFAVELRLGEQPAVSSNRKRRLDGLAPGDEISSRDEKSPLPIDDPAGGALVGVLRQDERDRVDRVAIDVAATGICDVTRLGLARRGDLAAGRLERAPSCLSPAGYDA